MKRSIAAIVGAMVALTVFLPATNSVAADLITEPVDSRAPQTLTHHIPAWATVDNDVGEVGRAICHSRI